MTIAPAEMVPAVLSPLNGLATCADAPLFCCAHWVNRLPAATGFEVLTSCSLLGSNVSAKPIPRVLTDRPFRSTLTVKVSFRPAVVDTTLSEPAGVLVGVMVGVTVEVKVGPAVGVGVPVGVGVSVGVAVDAAAMSNAASVTWTVVMLPGTVPPPPSSCSALNTTSVRCSDVGAPVVAPTVWNVMVARAPLPVGPSPGKIGCCSNTATAPAETVPVALLTIQFGTTPVPADR